MSTSPLELGSLDEPRSLTPDPEIWQRNLAALAATQPEFAACLRATELPPTWRAVRALDDFPTWRTEPPGEPPAWLADSAIPLTRARSRLETFDPRGKNPALACLGAAGELRVLLDRLPPFNALYIFETDLRAVAAALRLHDLAAEIETSRCVFLPPGQEHACLTRLLAAQPGLLPPSDVVLTDLVPPSRVEELRSIGESINRQIADDRTRRLAELQNAPLPTLPPAGPVRFAALGLAPEPEAQFVAQALARAAGQLGWPTSCARACDPLHLHPLVHCQTLHDFGPELVVSVNHPPHWLPVRHAQAQCAWILDERAAAERADAPDTLLLAASPRVAAALREKNPSLDRVHLWPWACEADEDAALDSCGPDAAGPVLLLGDCPDRRAERNAIVHSSHLLLWQEATHAVEQTWTQPLVADSERLLTAVERNAGLELRDPELRSAFLRTISRVLIPAITIEQLARTLIGGGRSVVALGRGWERSPVPGITVAGRHLADWPARETARPAACVVSAIDPLGPGVLHAAAHGWPILLHAPRSRDPFPDLGGVLRGEHVRVFHDSPGLWGALEWAAGPGGREQASRARSHVRARHSYRQRLVDLVGLLRNG